MKLLAAAIVAVLMVAQMVWYPMHNLFVAFVLGAAWGFVFVFIALFARKTDK